MINNVSLDKWHMQKGIIETKREKAKVEHTKDKEQKKLPQKNLHTTLDKMGDNIKQVILDQISQRNLILNAAKVIPMWIINFLVTRELPKDQYLLPTLNWMTKKIESGNYNDTDARNIARLARPYLKETYLHSVREATQREIESMDKYLRKDSQSTLDDIYEGKPKEAEKEKPASK